MTPPDAKPPDRPQPFVIDYEPQEVEHLNDLELPLERIVRIQGSAMGRAAVVFLFRLPLFACLLAFGFLLVSPYIRLESWGAMVATIVAAIAVVAAAAWCARNEYLAALRG